MSLIETELIKYFDDKNNDTYFIDNKINILLTRYDFAHFNYNLNDNMLDEHLEFFKTQQKFRICSYEILETLIKYNLHTQITHLDILISNLIKKDEFNLKSLVNFTNLIFLHIDGHKVHTNIGNVTQYLPNSLEILIIDHHWFDYPLFNHPKKEELEKNVYGEPKLKFLYIKSNNFNQSVDNLPVTLETLVIKSNNFNHRIDYLPPSLKSLVLICSNFYESIDNLPYGLEFLAVKYLNYDIIYKNDIELKLFSTLPITLKTFISEEPLNEDIIKTILPNCCFIQLNFQYFSLSIIQTLFNIYIMSKNTNSEELLYYVDNLYVV